MVEDENYFARWCITLYNFEFAFSSEILFNSVRIDLVYNGKVMSAFRWVELGAV